MLLTILTFALSWIDLGGWAAPVALLIATAKSLLVLFIFMHLLQARASSGLLLAAALLLAVILLALIAADVLTRQVLHTPPVVG
jgi:cytochrome c oxidase subunit 4